MPIRPSILLIALAVLGIHAWLLLGPVTHWTMPSWATASTPRTVQAVWLPPALPAAKLPLPTDAPTPAPASKTFSPARPSAQRPAPIPPRPPVRTAPEPALSANAIPALAPEPAVTALPEAAAAHPPTAPPATLAPAPTTGPALQVRTAHGPALALQLPTDGSALSSAMALRYQVHGVVKGLEYHARASLEWRTEGDQYYAQQRVSAFLLGSLEQTSQGRLTDQGLQPEHFEDRRLTQRRSVVFDWTQHLARFTPERPPAPIGSGAQDRLSVLLQLAAMLHTTPALREPGTRIEVPTLGSRSLQIWTFEVLRAESLALPSGDVPTLLLQRLPAAGEADSAQLWLAPHLGFVPLRIHLQEAGDDHLNFIAQELPAGTP